MPYATPTLWAAIQYLGPRETAPEHRHSQNAFRFVVEGEGVWTVVDGDPIAMRRGDFLLTPGWAFHGHHNETDEPMAWIDGLDIPFVHYPDTGFFEFGSAGVTDTSTPDVSRSERLWAHPGLRPLVGIDMKTSSTIACYRWEHTDAAIREQLLLEDEGYAATTEPGHAAGRYINPTTGGDVMPTIRAEFHRLRAGVATRTRRDVGSTVFQVLDGEGRFRLDQQTHEVTKGDLIVVPSWVPWPLETSGGIDLFAFSDAPIVERLHFHRTHISEMGRELPVYPTLFSKFKAALTGPYDDVIVPAYAASQLDWEAELAVVIGKQPYQVPEADADAYIAGYSVINDYTMRDYQYRTMQWDQGKTFEKTSGFGPVLDTDYQLGTRIETRLEGEVMQSATTDDLVFAPAQLVDYISHIVTLQPGDVIITGTTGGVGHARKPARYIGDGEPVEVNIGGLGSVRDKTIFK